jgi:hypothetical protein
MPRTVARRKAFRAALALAGTTARAFADQQGVTPEHLSYVLNGQRESRRLMDEVDAFIAKHLPQISVTAA